MSSLQLPSALEAKLEQEHAAIKAHVEKTARHFGKRNLPAPEGDCFDHYFGESRTRYETLHAEVQLYLQPGPNLPEAKIDRDQYRLDTAACDQRIKQLKDENDIDEFEMPALKPGSLNRRRWYVRGAALLLFVGEVLFNTKAFQVTGENQLFSMILSAAVTAAIFVFSHSLLWLYRKARTAIQRCAVIAGSLVIVTGVFMAMSVFRSTYLEAHGVTVSFLYFLLINLFLFLVMTLLVYQVWPSAEEVAHSDTVEKKLKVIAVRADEIQDLEDKKTQLAEQLAQRTQQRIRVVHLARQCTVHVRKMHDESEAVFKRTNRMHRKDGKVPDCFTQNSAPDINDVEFIASNPTLL